MTDSTSDRAARGAAWLIVTSLGARMVGVVGTIIIAHFLEPDVVGEVSVAAIVSFTASWFTTWGFGSYAVVFGRGEHALEVTWHATVAYIGLGMVSLLGVIAVRAPVTAMLHAPHAAAYVPGMALAVFIKRIGAVPERVLSRSLRFRAIGVAAALGEIVFALSAVTLAARGWGGESIIIANLIQSTTTVALLIRAAGFREWATPVKLKVSRFRDMLRFGLPLAVQSTAHNAARYWDNLTVSYLFGEHATGTYNYAYNLSDIPATNVGEQLALVLLPSMASLPPERRPRALERSAALLSLIIFPLAVGLGVVAQPLIRLIFSDEWQGVAPLLTVLTVLSVFRPVTWVLGAYLEAQDKTGKLMWLEIAKVAMLIGGFFALHSLGLRWAATAVGIAYGVNAIAGVWLVAKDGSSPGRLLIGFFRPLLACGVMAAAVLGLRTVIDGSGVPVAAQLAIEVVVGAISYVIAAFIFCRSTAQDLIRLARGVIRKRRGSAPVDVPPAP